MADLDWEKDQWLREHRTAFKEGAGALDETQAAAAVFLSPECGPERGVIVF